MATLGLGLAALGRPGYLNLSHGEDLGADRSVDALRARSHEVLDAAYAGGVRHFDAARSYGRAEEFLGAWLRSREPAGVTVSLQVGLRLHGGLGDRRRSARGQAPRRRDVPAPARRDARAARRLARPLRHPLRHAGHRRAGRRGRARRARAAPRDRACASALSVSGTSQRATVEHALALGAFDAVQATWNLHERSVEPALAAASAAGLTVYVKEALANGRLAGRAAAPELTALAAERGTTADALALAAVLAQPWADVVLSGAATVETLRSNLAAAELDGAALALDLREDPDAYWDQRSALEWR